MPDNKPTILTSVTDDNEIMATMPNGRMSFMSFWIAVKCCCRAMWSGFRVEVEK